MSAGMGAGTGAGMSSGVGLAQLHYTSAPPGPDGSGFRFTAVTPGLSPALLREVEQIIGYEPPRNAPARPDQAELAAFPRAFSYSQLSDGGRLLCRTSYTGADYSGRWGNFHAHAVYLPPGARLPGGRLPVTAWESPQWSSVTPGSGVPEPLTALSSASSADSADWMSEDSLTRFARARAAWLPGFLADVRAVSGDPAAPQILLVESDSTDVARWIALANASLPRDLAEQLTFSTYARRPDRARQQIVGIPPDTDPATGGGPQPDHRYRVHDCTGRPPGAPDAPAATDPADPADLWASVCALVWRAGRPGLFRAAEALPTSDGSSGGGFDGGRLAAVALHAGIGLDPAARSAAAAWAAGQARTLDPAWLGGLALALTAPSGQREQDPGTGREPGPEPQRPEGEWRALVRLLQQLSHRADPPALAPLAAQLAPELRAGIVSGPEPLELLGLAARLGIDCTDQLPALSARLARTLVSTEDPRQAEAVQDALWQHPALRGGLLAELDALAADDPPAVARMLARTALPVADSAGTPHLRMCADRTPEGDRPTALRQLLHRSGAQLFQQPLLLRTGFALLWEGGSPSATDAAVVLAQTGPEIHRAAGTWSSLLEAALGSGADDPQAPALAGEILRCFPDELRPRERAALQLLRFADDLVEGSAEPGWTPRALALRAAAHPAEAGITDRVFAVLTARLLQEPPQSAELYLLARAGDPALNAAYDRAARGGAGTGAPRFGPGRVAVDFLAWTSFAGTHPAWDDLRATLLHEVLRPVARALSAQETAEVEQALARVGGGRAEEFREWNRPGTLGRFAQRLGARTRRARTGDVPAAGPGREGSGLDGSGRDSSGRDSSGRDGRAWREPVWGDVEPPKRGNP
jgi:GTPase-associated protein 1, C-terminal domain/GTPase-associated protein 1, N-terminal domain type 2/GTPase-associated protein 1, middle domain